MLSLNHVSISYGSTEVVKDISFDLNNNTNLSIIGPNGCGKTTLLKAIAHLLPYQGDIKINGITIHEMKHTEFSLKVAMLNQISHIYFSYSVFDTVMMGRYLHIKDKLFGLPSKKDKEYVMECLTRVHLLNEKDKQITQLSGGQLQRVFLARTLAQEPDIILLDEPTNHLDLKHQIELVTYLKQWASSGNRSVIGVFHDINLAMHFSDYTMVMKQGKIVAYGNTNETLNDSILEYVYDINVGHYMRNSLKKWNKIK